MKPECFRSGIVDIPDSCDGENCYVWSIQDRPFTNVYDHIMTETGSYRLMPGGILEKTDLDEEIDNALQLEIDPIVGTCKHNFGFTNSSLFTYALYHYFDGGSSIYLFQSKHEISLTSLWSINETPEKLLLDIINLLHINFEPDKGEYLDMDKVDLKDIPVLENDDMKLGDNKTEDGPYYLIYLQGQGDARATVIDKESWDWIHNPDTSAPTPESIKQRYIKANAYMYQNGEEDEELLSEVEDLSEDTSGSWDNDRALKVPGIFINGFEASLYDSPLNIADTINFWKKQLGIKDFESTFEGSIY